MSAVPGTQKRVSDPRDLGLESLGQLKRVLGIKLDSLQA